eukprot:TRINITY_DN10780_c0_g1_i1.p1 TRINITY_DN10780_c0_g1~~TRINITY_DN10780_c0_g1_i1.p1  ORF type:complete len:516 (+),score=208.00 TRINITY_DN10780_c0_g1_i1:79-1626(+)
MPLLWGLTTLPTMMELAVMMVAGKVSVGLVSGLPGYIYGADRLLRGLQFLRMPSMDELKASELGKEKKKTSELKKVKALARDSISPGQAYQLPFFTALCLLVDLAFVGTVCAPIRMLWTASVGLSDAPEGTVADTQFAPFDVVMIFLFLLSVVLIGGLHYLCYSNSDAVGWGANFAAAVAALFAWGILMVEEVEALNFAFTDSYNAFTTHDRYLERGFLKWVPYMAMAVVVFVVSVTLAYGTLSTTWRLVRCHYQLSDRNADMLKNLEEMRGRQLLNYNLAIVNEQMGAAHGGAGGAGDEGGPPAELLVDQYGQYQNFHQRVLSWITLASPFLLAATFLHKPWKAHHNVHIVRQGIAAAMVVSRVLLCRTYLQTYLLRDTHEAAPAAGKDQSKITQALSSVHSRAVLLVVRTAIMLLAPATAMFALTMLSVRMNPAGDAYSTYILGDMLKNRLPPALTSHEFLPPSDIPDGAFWQRLVSYLMFWLAASEALYVFCFCSYRWFLSLVFRNQKERSA